MAKTNERTAADDAAIINRISQIVDPEWMTPAQAASIAKLWRVLKPKHILEIGTYKGTGACYLGALAESYGGRVVTVDLPWTGDPDQLTPQAESQLEKCGVKNVTVIRREDGGEGLLHDHFARDDAPWDFIYIDSHHDWNSSCAQFVMAWAAVRIGGWVALDDVRRAEWPGIRDAWHFVIRRLAGQKFVRDEIGFVMRRRMQVGP